jgi:hypothetical protein
MRDRFFGDDEGFRAFQNDLMEDPRKGRVIPGCGGVRKVRWMDPMRGKGKRGGIRVIYVFIEEADLILLMLAYDKSVADMTSDQKKAVAAAANAFRREVIAHMKRESNL